MSCFKNILAAIVIVSLLLGLSSPPGVRAQAGPPSYQLQYLGPGDPVAINNNGVVVGRVLIAGTSNYRPLVSSAGSPWAALPIPAGAMTVSPMDINDHGVIVGVSYSPQWNPVAIRWVPTGGGYTVEELPRLAGDPSSYATGINNLGQIVGARRALGYVPTGTGWLYSAELGLVDLAAQYGLWTYPTRINDLGQVISGAERLDINTGVLEWVGDGPANYNAINVVDINNTGMMVGSASQSSTSLNISSVFRYQAAIGWQFIAGTSRYTFASNINDIGDIGYGELGAGLYLEGLGNFALWSLLDPAVVNAGWAIGGSGCIINNQRLVAAFATNTQTGQSGAVLLTPSGVLAPPSAPANLQGVSHPATRMEPYNSINLTWENTSPLTQGYELERSATGAGSWVRLALTPPGTATNHTDVTVGVGVTYDYRVRATGVGGASSWSNVATVTAPATPLDTTPPVVSVLTPANGASVTGIVPVSAQATDNVALEYLEISFWNQYTGQQVSLGSVNNAGALSVNWDTRSLTPAAYTLRAYAYDTLGNWSQAEITVNVTSSTGNTLKVTSIVLSGTVKRTTATINADVTVKNNLGQAVSNANVTVKWTLPNGSTQTAAATTNSLGRVRFTVTGPRGTYKLTIVNVTRSGYTFDLAGSVLTKSITK